MVAPAGSPPSVIPPVVDLTLSVPTNNDELQRISPPLSPGARALLESLNSQKPLSSRVVAWVKFASLSVLTVGIYAVYRLLKSRSEFYEALQSLNRQVTDKAEEIARLHSTGQQGHFKSAGGNVVPTNPASNQALGSTGSVSGARPVNPFLTGIAGGIPSLKKADSATAAAKEGAGSSSQKPKSLIDELKEAQKKKQGNQQSGVASVNQEKSIVSTESRTSESCVPQPDSSKIPQGILELVKRRREARLLKEAEARGGLSPSQEEPSTSVNFVQALQSKFKNANSNNDTPSDDESDTDWA